MSRSSPDRCMKAKEDAARVLGQHVMVDEPVRSFRFHAHNISRSYDKGRRDLRPGFATFEPKEGAKFSYTSFYAFNLTWTPGHMTLVGDLGTLTIVHYNAMPTLEQACEWLLNPDYGYLLSKTKLEQAFDKDLTIDRLWGEMIENVEEYAAELEGHIAQWEREKPKWRKRDGMTREDYEQELEYWKGDDPRLEYHFRREEPPRYLHDRTLWTEAQRDGWHVPDGFELIYRCWKYFREHHYGVDADPNSLFTAEGREALKEALENWADGEATDVIITWIVRDLCYDDYYGEYDYPSQAYFQLAAIQHGARMILDDIRKQQGEMRHAA